MAVVRKMEDVPERNMSDGKEIVGVTKRLLIGPVEGAPTFAVRLFTLAPGGHTPAHAHPYEHGVVVLSGRGEVHTAQGAKALEASTVVWMPPGEHHQFRNTGTEPLKFLCVVPAAVEKT